MVNIHICSQYDTHPYVASTTGVLYVVSMISGFDVCFPCSLMFIQVMLLTYYRHVCTKEWIVHYIYLYVWFDIGDFNLYFFLYYFWFVLKMVSIYTFISFKCFFIFSCNKIQKLLLNICGTSISKLLCTGTIMFCTCWLPVAYSYSNEN